MPGSAAPRHVKGNARRRRGSPSTSSLKRESRRGRSSEAPVMRLNKLDFQSGPLVRLAAAAAVPPRKRRTPFFSHPLTSAACAVFGAVDFGEKKKKKKRNCVPTPRTRVTSSVGIRLFLIFLDKRPALPAVRALHSLESRAENALHSLFFFSFFLFLLPPKCSVRLCCCCFLAIRSFRLLSPSFFFFFVPGSRF